VQCAPFNEKECLVRVLFLGDIVGRPGRKIVVRAAQWLRERESLDLIIANAENAAGGSGITPAIYRELTEAGVDCITLGDHIYRRNDIVTVLEKESNIVKPANFPTKAPGRDWTIVEAKNGVPVAVFSLIGRVFMKPVDCPWEAADRILNQISDHVLVRFVDFHAEATSDKQLMGRYLDGQVTAVLGTHTHVPTADQCIFPGGTAFQCDVGMTGPYESILGRRIDRVMETTRTFRPLPFDVASQDVRLGGAIVDVDAETGTAREIRRVAITESDLDQMGCR